MPATQEQVYKLRRELVQAASRKDPIAHIVCFGPQDWVARMNGRKHPFGTFSSKEAAMAAARARRGIRTILVHGPNAEVLEREHVA